MNATPAKLPQPNRESLTAVNDDGSRRVIHPADVKGRFTARRRVVAYALIALYAALPWIRINGYPAVFLDLEAIRFHFFGLTFASQDLWLAFFLVSGLGFGLFYLTALAGRLWCGWACPQTVFLEHVYRRVERWIDGDAPARRRLDADPLTVSKILKRAVKHAAFALLSLAVAHLFMAYFLSIPKLWEMTRHAPAENWKAFVFAISFTAVLYFNYAFFREQLCIIVCPYGRLQSALIDDHSMVIGYDAARGEPRGKATLFEAGDCIDCNRCVQVCPTGIDIRQGLQMECVGCSNCIDACDAIMDRLKRPRGLIRYDSQEGLAGRPTKIVRSRTVLYTILALAGLTVLTFSLRGLGDATLTVWRMPGAPYYIDQDEARNQFMARVTNKDNAAREYRLEIDIPLTEARVLAAGESFRIEGNGEAVKPIVATAPLHALAGSFTMTVRVVDEKGETLASRELEFVGPKRKAGSETKP